MEKSKAIETISLSKNYGKTTGIKNLDLTVERGEIFGFIGPNGAGKSTTIRLLFNLIFPNSGSGKVLGYDIIKHSKEIKFKTGYLPAEVNYYYKMTVNELLEYSQRFYGVNDSKRLNELADDLDLKTNLKIRDLSLGNKKKVSLIQALLHKPELLILDEPTSGLDPLIQSKVFELFKKENERGCTIFFSSHVLNDVQKICSRVAIIQKGSIIQLESIDALRKKMLKKISVSFTENQSDIKLDLPAIVDFKRVNNHMNFLFNGDMNDLISYLANLKIENISIEEPTLEEIFLHYYQNAESGDEL